MRSLFGKGMLAFLLVVLVAVGTAAFLVGRMTESEFRQYALLHGGVWDRQVAELSAYFAAQGSWQGVQEIIETVSGGGGPRQYGPGGGPMRPAQLDFRLVDAAGQVVGDTQSPRQEGTVSPNDLERSLPIEVDGQVVGYLLPAPDAVTALPLDAPQAAFLQRVRTILWVGGLAGLGAALVVGGLLFRSIVSPLRRLTSASQAVARGDLSARLSVRGQDEVAQLAAAFNQMAEELDRTETARRNQTADVAHELRTPLTLIQGTLEAMLDGVYPVDRQNLLVVLDQANMLRRLVEDLRVLALADAGQLRLYPAPLDLADFFRGVEQAYQPRAQERAVALVFAVPPGLPIISADRDRLAQVVGNLLDNALRYAPAGGRISVTALAVDEALAIRVADDGPGVSPELLPQLFERFWRGDPARRQETGGSGLGLSIARQIVEMHGGRIWAETTPGGGLTVVFTLANLPGNSGAPHRLPSGVFQIS
ncbi:MAG: HAMP domain-containing protein [Anaerolineae bacterium]|nr:HAMP domain-containing protein [Anaerolineae bacterium]